jgi:hypothetical protein
MSVYIRELKEDIIKLNQQLKINNFLPEGILEMIEENVPENNYILGVRYTDGDGQICISGHQKEDEDINEGCERELTEELFLKCKSDINYLFNNDINYFYCISIKDTYISKIYNHNKCTDLKNRAVICIHGNEYEILRYMSKLKIQERLNDTINGIWAARKNKVVSTIRKIYSTKKKCFIY